nr:site-specific integrase [Mobiluncus curtisii]
MVRFAALCGLRACEICTLRGNAWDGELLRVKGKGGRVRVIPLQDSTLIYSLESCPGWLFPGRIDGHLSAQYTAKLLGSALPPGVTGHSLRHRFGTVAYRATHDLLAVGAVMGHVKTDTTNVISSSTSTHWHGRYRPRNFDMTNKNCADVPPLRCSYIHV